MTVLTSVVVVNYNAGPLLADCIEAVLASTVAVEVIVSDNGSTDDSLALLSLRCGNHPGVQVIRHGKNLGFSESNNRALAKTDSTSEFVLFLNPDCIVEAATLEGVLKVLTKHQDGGMAGCVIRNPDGSEQHASRRRIPTPWSAFVGVLRLDKLLAGLPGIKGLSEIDKPLPSTAIKVEAISGSFMMVRRKALNDVGLLDSSYFLHCEDLDWFVRFVQAGWSLYFVPFVWVTHYKGACSHRRPFFVEWHKHRGMARFFLRFQAPSFSFPIRMLVLLGIWLHFLATSVGILLGRIGFRRRVRAGQA
ncbi:MAG: glycosyltransferase family 2 protein [Lamprobacter sp.]|uniref:glycosyltransferase family 2 protein n=1 Tax=Lamprobacter sp. TaxID=3100796 RepID=UPI002B25C231|nr:glycosyltransferase family 2 protein [Lamprobacter sp.]MEA3638320.1 glycosyltransferase family 2 protein [Lamprobacter sp.]